MIVAGSATTWLVGSRGTRPTYAGDETGLLRAIEHPQHVEMREAVDVGEPRLEHRQGFGRPPGLVFRPASLRNRGCVCKGSVDETARAAGKHPPVAFAIEPRGLRGARDTPEPGRPAR